MTNHPPTEFNVASTDILTDANIIALVVELKDPRAEVVAKVVARRLLMKQQSLETAHSIFALATARLLIRGVL